MAQIHFHVVENDVGYLPDDDSPNLYEAVDEAIDAALEAAERHMDATSQMDDGEIIRGQQYAKTPVTAGMEISNVQAQVDEIERQRKETDLSLDVANHGLIIVLENGIRVIEIMPCVEDCLEGDQSHVENW
jgi:hypothetical protein